MKRYLVLFSMALLLITGGVVMAQDDSETEITAENVERLSITTNLSDDENDYYSASLNPDATLVAFENVSDINVFDIASGDLIFEILATSETEDGGRISYGAPLFIDDNTLAYGEIIFDVDFNFVSNTTYFVTLPDGEQVTQLNGIPLAYYPSLNALITVDQVEFSAALTDLADESTLWTLGEEALSSWYFAPQYSADGSTVVILQITEDEETFDATFTFEVYDASTTTFDDPRNTFNLTGLLEGGEVEVDSVGLSADGGLLIVSFEDYVDADNRANKIQAYDTTTGEVVWEVDRTEENNGAVTVTTFTNDGSAVLLNERELLLAFDATTGELLTQFVTPIPGNLEVLEFSTDGTQLLAAAYETAVIYTVE
jgi:outer membrane protein assembly factor BamB